MKNILIEGVNSGNLEPDFMSPGEAAGSKEKLTIPGMSYIVTVWPGMVSYPRITRTSKVALDRYVHGLEFMTAVCRKRENSHSILLAVV
jgi:hypothetical protein